MSEQVIFEGKYGRLHRDGTYVIEDIARFTGELMGAFADQRAAREAAEAKLATVTTERDAARQMRDAFDKQASDLFMACYEKNQALSAAQQRVERLEKITPYARHTYHCGHNCGECCDCGLSAALTESEAAND